MTNRISTVKKPRKNYKKKSKTIKFVTKQRKLKRKRKIGLVIMAILITLSNVLILGTVTLAAYLQNRLKEIPQAETVFDGLNLASEIYDRNGGRLYRMFADDSNADKLTFNEVNNYTIAAFLAAEDAEFFHHGGVSLHAISRCAVKALKSEGLCGGSTITQQLVKIRTKKNQPTFERKLDEIFLANAVEQKFTKTQILELYLNTTPYGSNIVGLRTAAKFYFNQEDISKLTLAQSVALAAIVNDPNQLTPSLSNEEVFLRSLENRMGYVYTQLELKKDIIVSQINEIRPESAFALSIEEIQNSNLNEELQFAKARFDIKSGHFVNYVIQELQKRPYKNGQPFTYEELQNGGYRIYTTVDPTLQAYAEKYALFGGENYKGYNIYNAALMTIDPATGEVLSMAGSKSFTAPSEGCDASGNNCKFNPEVNVLTTHQSPGSTNKPLGYYEAFNEGKLFPGSILPDVPISFGGYKPKNWDSRFYGPDHSAGDMLKKSRNIPALIVMQLIGIDRYKQVAKDFGYTTYENADVGLSLILGGGDILPTEHIEAYGVFANGGNRVPIDPIKKILDANGNVIYEAKPQALSVADPAAVFQLNQTLNRLDAGTGATINWDWRDVAGKTGTTENNMDNWLIIYSPDFVTMAWSGNNNNEQLNTLYGWPAFTLLPLMKAYMTEATNSGFFVERTPFINPGNVYWGGGNCVNGKCRGKEPNWLIAGREPAMGDLNYGNRPTSSQVITTDENGNQQTTTVTSNQKFKYYYSPIPEVQNALNWYR